MDLDIETLTRRFEELGKENRRLIDELAEIAILYETTIDHGEAVEDQLADTNTALAFEKKKSDDLLLNILPAETAEELKESGFSAARSYDRVTVMFTDFKGFTRISETLTPQQLVAELDFCFRAFDEIIGRYPIEKIKTIGDSYMCAGGLPSINETHPFDIVSAALEIQGFMNNLREQKAKRGELCFEMRVGIHTGPVVAGIVGARKFAYDIWGDTVNTASRMESSCVAGKVNISGTTWEIVHKRFNCTHRGKIEAKNKGEIDMYFVEGVRPAAKVKVAKPKTATVRKAAAPKRAVRPAAKKLAGG